MAYTPVGSATEPVVKPKKMYDPNAKGLTLNPADFTGFNPEDVASAGSLVNEQYFGQEQEQRSAIDQIQDFLGRDIDVEQTYGKNQQGYLEDIYSQLAQQLGQGVERQEALYGGAAGQIGQGYSDAQTEAQKAAQAIQGSLTGSAQKLGQEDTLTDPLARLNAEMQALNARLAGSKAGAVGNMQALGASMVGEGVKGIGTSQREKVQGQQDIANQVLRNMGKLQTGAQEETMAGLRNLVNLKGTQGAAVRNALEGLRTARTERERQAYQDKLDEELKRANLALQQRSQIASENQFAQQMAMEREKASAVDPMDALNYQLKKLELDEKLNPDSKIPGELTGRQGLDYWLKQQGGNTNQASAIRNFISDAEGSKNKAGMDPYTFAVQTIRESQAGKKLTKPQTEMMKGIKDNKMDPNDVLTGLQIYFNQYGKVK